MEVVGAIPGSGGKSSDDDVSNGGNERLKEGLPAAAEGSGSSAKSTSLVSGRLVNTARSYMVSAVWDSVSVKARRPMMHSSNYSSLSVHDLELASASRFDTSFSFISRFSTVKSR